MILEGLLALAGAFLITFLAIPMVIEIARNNGLYDPTNSRKLHFREVSSLGGAAIFTGFFVSCMLFIKLPDSPEFRFYLAGALIIFFLGLKDDLVELDASKKLIVQVAVAAILIHAGGLRLEGMYGLFGVTEVPELFSIVLTYFTIIVIMNAYNLIDGVDGLAAGLSLLSLSVFAVYFWLSNDPAYVMLALSLAGSLLAFLIFNRPPARVFMGDSGSLLVGTIQAILVIHFIQSSSSPTASLPVYGAVSVGFSILSVPLLDTLRMFALRLFRGQSPFHPDRDHLHHLLLGQGFSHGVVTWICVLLNVSFILIAWYFRFLGSTLCLLTQACVALVALRIFYLSQARRRRSGRTEVSISEANIVEWMKEPSSNQG